MMEKELGKWTKLLCVCCCVLVVGSRAVRQGHEVNYRGCQILTDECLHDDDCDYHDLHQRCGQYFARHRTKDTDDALPPISLAEMWPFFPRHALGPEKNRKMDAYFRHQRSPVEEDTEIEANENQREDEEESPGYDDDKILKEDQPLQPVRRGTETRQNQRKLYRSLGELRSPHLEANTGQYLETKPLHNQRDINGPGFKRSLTGSLTDGIDENFGTRPSRRDVQSNRKFETRSVQSEVKTNGQYDHPAGNSHLRNQIYEIYTRLSRLADLNNADDWTGKNPVDGGYKDYKIPSRIKNNDHKSHRGLSEPDHVDKILLNEKEVADKQLQDGVKVDSKKIIDYLNFHQSRLAERARPSDTQYLEAPTADQPGLKVDVDKKSDKTQTLEDSKFTEKSSPRLEAPKRSSEETSGAPKSANFYPAKNDEKSSTISKTQQTESSDDVGTLILQTANSVDPKKLNTIGGKLQKVLWDIDPSERKIFDKVSINKNINLHMNVPSNLYSSEFDPHIISKRINTDASLRKNISGAIGFTVIGAQSKKPEAVTSYPISLPKDKNWDEFAIIIAVVGGCTLGLIVASLIICSLKRRGHHKNPIEFHKKEAKSDYEELCRTKMAVNAATSPRSLKAVKADRQRHGLVDNNGKITSKSWREEPLAYNMDITTGHVILSYMEDHLNDENKLSSEWEALCNYKADQDETTVSEESKNTNKNRYSNVLPYDHTRVKLRETANVFHSDYINASYITDADPRNPAYIATQGPLDNTVADFWQMIWEQGVVVIVNLTRLSDMGLPQCHRYWPEEGSDVYNTYQVHLISEHIWCDDYIVRSFYLKHLMTSETRTVTQFHFLTWPDLSVPESAKPILEFRRKVNKCYRGQACPIVVHCNNGVGRTGTYILIDMVLKKMIKGTKEIDIAATLEHLRDQRPDMVKTKAQFEFTLAAVAEEVTAILSSLSS